MKYQLVKSAASPMSEKNNTRIEVRGIRWDSYIQLRDENNYRILDNRSGVKSGSAMFGYRWRKPKKIKIRVLHENFHKYEVMIMVPAGETTQIWVKQIPTEEALEKWAQWRRMKNVPRSSKEPLP